MRETSTSEGRNYSPPHFASRSVIYKNPLGSFTCRKAGTWYILFYFPSEGRHIEDFSGLNPRTRVPVASILTTRPPKSSFLVLEKGSSLCSSNLNSLTFMKYVYGWKAVNPKNKPRVQTDMQRTVYNAGSFGNLLTPSATWVMAMWCVSGAGHRPWSHYTRVNASMNIEFESWSLSLAPPPSPHVTPHPATTAKSPSSIDKGRKRKEKICIEIQKQR
jgi:hypothetical protein